MKSASEALSIYSNIKKDIRPGCDITTSYSRGSLKNMDIEALSKEELRIVIGQLDFLNSAAPDNSEKAYDEGLQTLVTKLKKHFFDKFNEKALG